MALDQAKALGATQAHASVSEDQGLSLTVRHGQIETVEHHHDCHLSVSVYVGHARASANTSSLNPQAICDTVRAAFDIAQYTQGDPAMQLPDPQDLATDFPDLALHKPWEGGIEQATALATQAEAVAMAVDPAISNSEGASVNIHTGQFLMGNSHGFLAGYPHSSYSISACVIAGSGADMQRDYWYQSHRYPEQCLTAEHAQAVGQKAGQRAVARLGARRLPTGQYPILFEAPLAAGLVGSFIQAINGNALYRQSSFLCDRLHQTVFADHIQIEDDPFILGAFGSSAFDQEGVRTQKRFLVQDGVLQGYLLSSYTARKLNMTTTGNAGGAHNVICRSRLTQASDDLPAMLARMGTGLLVTELIGQGVNYVTGDYSRGAQGFWVENGIIQYPVTGITIAGNLNTMFRDIVAVGADTFTRGAIQTGSLLIRNMAVAGQTAPTDSLH